MQSVVDAAWSLFVTSVTALSSQLPNLRAPFAGEVVAGRVPGTPTQQVPAADTPAPKPAEQAIDARVDAQRDGGALTEDQASSLKDFFGEGAGGASTGSLMRTASEQLDQFDRVLDKLRASLSAGSGYGATYGTTGAAPMTGGSGLVVDRLA